jgi:RNA polymerase sigma-70 factor (ECF subfamily)
MTVNVCRGAGRKRSKRREAFLGGDGFQQPEDSGKGPYAQLRAEEQKKMLYAALARLPEKERTAVVLRDIEGMTTAEVAEVLGSTEATVRAQISSARLKMRKAIVHMKGGSDVLS